MFPRAGDSMENSQPGTSILLQKIRKHPQANQIYHEGKSLARHQIGTGKNYKY
jgi:hypothetical protein